MRKTGKKFAAARQQVPERLHTIEDAVPLMQKVKYAKFDETVELAMRLGVDPKHADQMVRGTVVLPHGLGKSKRVLAIAGGDKQKEAQDAGADVVGGEELVEKIQGGWMDFDAVVATPDMMRAVGKLGKVLGPRGPDAEPEDRNGHAGHRAGGQGDQGRQGRVPRRQDRHRARPDRQDFVRVAEPDRERPRAGRQRRQGEAVRCERQVPAQRDDVVDDGAGDRDRHDARNRGAETLNIMAVTRAIKEEELRELEQSFKGTDSAIVVDFKGLKVPEVTELRRQVRGARGQYKVVKNTLAKRALKGTRFEALSETFTRHHGRRLQPARIRSRWPKS